MVFSLHIRYIRALCITILAIAILAFCMYQITIAPKIIILDARLSMMASEQLRKNLVDHQATDAQKLLAYTHENAGAIKNISVRKLGALRTKVIAQAFDPLYRVKNKITGKMFVLAGKALIAEEYYLPSILEDLPIITLETDERTFNEQSFIDTCIHLPISIFDTYHLFYKNKTDIQLVSKKQHLTIIANHETVQNSEKIAYAEILAEKKYSKWVTIDIRFAHGAVCTPKGR